MDIIEQVQKGEKIAIARLITMLENQNENAVSAVESLYCYNNRPMIIGITGPPGVGKSTLTGRLAKQFRLSNEKVGIIAVDPSSPFNGGAILGDRIRMFGLDDDPGVFLRSMGTRGSIGGLSRSVYGAIKVFGISGMKCVFVETVGTGQNEIDISKIADITIVLLTPGLGDDIQAIKAGLMEIADIFVINKADMDGADQTVRYITSMLDLDSQTEGRKEIIKAIARDGKGTQEIYAAIMRRYQYLQNNGMFENKTNSSIDSEIVSIIQDNILSFMRKTERGVRLLDGLVSQVRLYSLK